LPCPRRPFACCLLLAYQVAVALYKMPDPSLWASNSRTNREYFVPLLISHGFRKKHRGKFIEPDVVLSSTRTVFEPLNINVPAVPGVPAVPASNRVWILAAIAESHFVNSSGSGQFRNVLDVDRRAGVAAVLVPGTSRKNPWF
jgi:hypothetical protein